MNRKNNGPDFIERAPSARRAIVSIVLAAMFFLCMVAFYNVYDDWEKQKREDAGRLLSAVEECASRQRAHIMAMEVLMRAVASPRLTMDVNSADFHDYLRSIDGIYPGYLRFEVLRADGAMFHGPDDQAVSGDYGADQAALVRGRSAFREMLKNGKFTVGEYIDSSKFPKLRGHAVLPMGMPIPGSKDEMRALLVAVQDMSADNGAFQNFFAQHGMETVFFDRERKLLYRYPPREGAVYGTPVTNTDLAAAMDAPEDKTVLMTRNPQGRESLFALVKLRQTDATPPYMYVLGISDRPYFTEFLTSGYLAQGLSTILAILLSIWLASCAGRRFFTTGLEALAARVNEARAGDLSARLGPIGGCREIRVLGRGMNAMLDSLEEGNEKLKILSNTDGLTGLYNRRRFCELAELEIKRALRGGSDMAFVMMDLDHFKKVNDAYGHDAGDAVLRAFSALLKENARSSDIVARFGGEEFVMLMPETRQDGAAAAMEKIRRMAAERPVSFRDMRIQYSISAGLRALNLSAANGIENVTAALEQALKDADTALYQAKESGRNRIKIFTALQS